MVEVCQQTNRLRCGDDGKVAERSCSQVEGAHKLLFVGGEFLFRHRELLNRNLGVLIIDLHHVVLLHLEVRMQGRMSLDDALDGSFELSRIGILVESQ